MIRKWLSQIKCFVLFLARAFAPTTNGPYPEFQFTATNFMPMTAKLSDLAEETSGSSLQADGQMEEPTQGAKDLQKSEEDDSSPSCLPLWSPTQRPPFSHPNMKYCLEIQVTLTEEMGAIFPPFSLLDGPTSRRYVARSQNWTY